MIIVDVLKETWRWPSILLGLFGILFLLLFRLLAICLWRLAHFILVAGEVAAIVALGKLKSVIDVVGLDWDPKLGEDISSLADQDAFASLSAS